MRLAVRVVVVAGVLLLALWGPWRVSAPQPGDGPATLPEGQPGATSPGGVHGEAVDVQGEADRPIREGYVVAVPHDGAGHLWAAAGLGEPEPHELPHANLDVQPAVVQDAGGTMAPIDGEGFALDVEPGDHLVCLARGHHPLQLSGCARTALRGDDRLRLTFGEGGVGVEVLD